MGDFQDTDARGKKAEDELKKCRKFEGNKVNNLV